MLKSALILVLALSLTACSKDDDGKKPDGGGKDNISLDTITTTNTAGCGEITPQGYSIFSNKWRFDEEDRKNGFKFMTIMDISQNSVGLEIACTVGPMTYLLNVRAAASVSNRDLIITSTDEKENLITVGDTNVPCKASLQAGMKLQYTFRGTCLQFGPEHILIPVQ
jgi:hypothetical protein